MSWMEVNGAGWSWMHGLALPIIAYILIQNVNPLKSGGQ